MYIEVYARQETRCLSPLSPKLTYRHSSCTGTALSSDAPTTQRLCPILIPSWPVVCRYHQLHLPPVGQPPFGAPSCNIPLRPCRVRLFQVPVRRNIHMHFFFAFFFNYVINSYSRATSTTRVAFCYSHNHISSCQLFCFPLLSCPFFFFFFSYWQILFAVERTVGERNKERLSSSPLRAAMFSSCPLRLVSE